jgi:Rrf2 family protein
MQITHQADYAVRAVWHVARLGDHVRVATAQIARDQHIPLTFLAKIVPQLSAVGVLRATRGAHGGVSLGRPAASISLLDVVEAIDGPITVSECTTHPDLCPLEATCAVREVWCEARTDLVRRLAQTSFEQLVERSRAEAPAIPMAV